MADTSRATRASPGDTPGKPSASTPGRSRNMQAIKRTGTKPEIRIRSALHRAGFRFRKDYPLQLGSIKVRPDIVFTRKRVAIFIDGCFWHVCPQHGRQPSTNEWYWIPKLLRNQERDRIADEALTLHGWQVVRIWEHSSVEEAIQIVEHVFDTS